MVRRVTDRKAVNAAMDEYDEIGRDAFLDKYKFGPALRFFVARNGKQYDSKAIYGAAHQRQFPGDGPVTSNDFSGEEQAVKAPLEALGFAFVADSTRDVGDQTTDPNLEITAEDVRLIARSRSKNKYADLSEDEHAAYGRISAALDALGNRLKSKLRDPTRFELRTTSGFSLKSGVRGYIPKDLWFSVSPRENKQDLAAIPQLFMIVSERGIEYGYGASVSPSDFSQQAAKDAVRAAAPKIFNKLPAPGSAEAAEMSRTIEASGKWFFRDKHRLVANVEEFADLDGWLRYLKSDQGKKQAAGAISRYLVGDEIERANLPDEMATVARIFEPLLDRNWHGSEGEDASAAEAQQVPNDRRTAELADGTEFAALLKRFMTAYDGKRTGTFTTEGELGDAMRELRKWLEQLPCVASRPTIKVRISVGQGGWTKTPWIALLDTRVTTSTQRGVYVVFLLAEDLSTTYLTLNQGMTDLVASRGQRGAVEEMHRVAQQTRAAVPELAERGFTLDRAIDLRSETSAARNYQEGTIAYVELPSDDLPRDPRLNDMLDSLLSSYERAVRAVSEPEAQESEPMLATTAYTIEDALQELFLEREGLERQLDIWRAKKNIILQGAPGVGKSFVARRLAYALIGLKDPGKVQTVQFHQSYSYEDFVQGYRPAGSQGFERKNGTFYEFRDRAIRDPESTHVFIIDEINRGNLSKIFGELMLLIEPDKRGPTWATRLTYATGDDEEFYVPENLFIVGMMNTADRSLSMVDYALRRRFAFVAMEPLFGSKKFQDYLARQGVSPELVTRIVTRMGELNQAIANDRANLGPGFRIGHSFFTPPGAVADAEAWYRRVVETEIHPLLEEYWFDAPETADQWRDRLLG